MPRVTITVPEKKPQPYRFQLDRQSVSLGRGSENDIVINCGSVSVKHAEMVRVEDGYQLRDLGSTNGIKLEDERREVIPLRTGASVKLGDVVFDFLLTEEEQEELAREKRQTSKENDRHDQAMADKDRDEDDKNDDQARPPRKKVAARESGGKSGSGGCGWLILLLFFMIFAAAAFCAGMAVRYQKATGHSWREAVQEKLGMP